MKSKFLYFFIFLILLSVTSLQAQWTNVGTPGFSAGGALNQSLVFHPTSNEPYLAYRDGANASKTTVMRFDGTNWVNVGIAGFSAGTSAFQSLAIHPTTGEPYVAYQDFTIFQRTTVMRFDGTNWVNVGTAGFSGGLANYQSLAFHPTTHEPYVAYQEDFGFANKATVMRFDGTDWVSVGVAGFSTSGAPYQSLAFHPTTHEPYVAFLDENFVKTSVMRFDGTNWVNVGSPGFSLGFATDQNLAFHPITQEPYVAYIDGSLLQTVAMMRFDGTNWVSVGTPAGFSTNFAQYLSFAFNPITNEPYVAYRDNASANKTTVMRFDGTNWTNVGAAGFSAAAADHQDMAFHPTTGEPYVAYRDWGVGTRATVMRFIPPPAPEITLSGNSNPILNTSVTPSLANHTDFGSVESCVGTSFTRTFTITNIGSGDLSLTGTPLIDITGIGAAMFSLTTPPANTVLPGENTTFVITYEPTMVGLHEAVVTIDSNDPNVSNFTFAIQGTGIDNTAPVFTTCITDQSVSVDATCGYTLADYTTMVAASDNCGTVTFTQTPAIGSAQTGVVLVTITANDGNGNTAVCTFNTVPNDVTPPTFTTCVANQTENLSATCGYTVPDYTAAPYNAAATDNCGTVTYTQVPAAGTVLSGVGTTNVTITATDGSGNDTDCDFTLTLEDNTAPLASCMNIDAVLDASGSITLNAMLLNNSSSDNCTASGDLNFVFDDTGLATRNYDCTDAGSVYNVDIRITDLAGNSSVCNANITVVYNAALTYSATGFNESSANDGSIGDTLTISAACPIFAGAVGDDFVGTFATV
ncbi:MAG: choice-of-anchor D domain-containing protein, partial [Bernardetiaceae bacterium]|nr:choice-of-anchor D domain-containing protein [Bernardetiaceae bacterium]